MQYVYTFREIAGDRAAASSDPDGANLPGGASAWKRLDKLETPRWRTRPRAWSVSGTPRRSSTRCGRRASPSPGRVRW